MTAPPVATLPGFSTLAQIIKSDDPSSWDQAWQNKITPWDAGDSQPPLREAIERSGIPFPRSGRALVPGCGSGYDVTYIATSLGLNTVGFDISETATTAARKLLETHPGNVKSLVTFQIGDFFTFKVPLEERFDLVYDYTFFVAIPPSRRPEWGAQMASLIKPGGYLITLVFPIDPPIETGPPFFVRPEHYIAPLGDKFEKVLDKDPEVSIESHKERERLVVWRRKED
ncbi:S-adenosyl-L-methionine-dependent methyltransferase [Crucibulum laeve]|uniref:S-adenosyl-L-methionine-dependent methyltransferase n=1 Tax=Crucibulum laeve TaxID=68775 RepID=A0A5C3LZW7_9AGAR|nr:S-adenosyl-L-methionine-dependent methyltransferase [Crucibulum laeve]